MIYAEMIELRGNSRLIFEYLYARLIYFWFVNLNQIRFHFHVADVCSKHPREPSLSSTHTHTRRHSDTNTKQIKM